MEEVYLTDKAFIGIIVSSVEVFPQECLGLLLGYREADRMTVEYAVPYQSARRRRGSVEPNERRESECIELLPWLSHLEHIGYYHSHTQQLWSRASPEPSDDDIDAMAEGQLDMIVAVNKASRARCWNPDRKGNLAGTIADYAFVLAAYHYHGQKRLWNRARIVCPYAVGFDNAFCP
jgi:proteasome lid subunit RPN8/RPN11